MRQIKDLPPKYNKKVDEYESKLKVPELLILDPDLQFIDDNKEYEKIIKNPLSLDDIITSLNINGKWNRDINIYIIFEFLISWVINLYLIEFI